jgi:hypothetical protein
LRAAYDGASYWASSQGSLTLKGKIIEIRALHRLRRETWHRRPDFFLRF